MSRVLDKDLYTDQIYYNINIGGEGDVPIPAKFSVNRVDEILSNPRDWLINVDSFTIPLFSVPLFQFFLQGEFIVTLSYNGSEVSKQLTYIPSGVEAGPNGPVYAYQTFIRMYNIAFSQAFADLLVLQPLIPATKAPYITLKGNLLSLNAEAVYLSNLPNPINIFMNKRSAEQFTSIPLFFITADKIQFLIQDLYTNLNSGIYTMTQTVEGISTWSKLNRILLETATLAIDKQLVGAQRDVQIQVIEDFIVEQDPNQPLDLIFRPKGPVRINSLVSNFPLTSIDVNIRWFSDEGGSEIILLPPKKRASIKIRFTKRKTLNLQNVDNQGINLA